MGISGQTHENKLFFIFRMVYYLRLLIKGGGGKPFLDRLLRKGGGGVAVSGQTFSKVFCFQPALQTISGVRPLDGMSTLAEPAYSFSTLADFPLVIPPQHSVILNGFIGKIFRKSCFSGGFFWGLFQELVNLPPSPLLVCIGEGKV